jgi:3,4-dihydroxy 2-butanone 4-phosphate synthase/GTP cyclohydrolase II
MPDNITFDSIESAIEDIRNGKMVIVIDDEDRENEGDFVMAAEKVTPEAINVMVTHGRGLVCVPINREKAHQLDLDYMVTEGADPDEAAFTTSIDHKALTTTGISASDRANTIREMTSDHSSAADFRRPGHIFPLLAVNGGVLRRAGHTEAAIDLARLAGLKPVGIICEIMKEDGEMARTPELFEIARKFGMKFITIKDLIAYRIQNESLVEEVTKVDMPTMYGDFKMHVFKEILTNDTHLALVKGSWKPGEAVLTRVHASDMIGDIFGYRLHDTGEQLHQAMLQVEREGKGVVVYMNRQSGEHDLVNQVGKLRKIHDGEESNDSLSYKSDSRDYGVGAQILRSLGITKLKLLTNNPVKRVGIKSFGLEIVDQVPFKDEIDLLKAENIISGSSDKD